MLTERVKDTLKNNWGEKADALECYAEVKFIDPVSEWCCYILAMEPGNENNIRCIIPDSSCIVLDWSLDELYACYNSEGEHLIIDEEYRKIKASILYRKIIGSI